MLRPSSQSTHEPPCIMLSTSSVTASTYVGRGGAGGVGVAEGAMDERGTRTRRDEARDTRH